MCCSREKSGCGEQGGQTYAIGSLRRYFARRRHGQSLACSLSKIVEVHVSISCEQACRHAHFGFTILSPNRSRLAHASYLATQSLTQLQC
jgi:hypothetical protein